MSKKMKRILTLILTVIITFNISGCAPLYTILDEVYGDEAVTAAESISYFGFSVEKELSGIKRMEATEFARSECISLAYSNNHFYQLLSPEEQLIYNAYLHAMEHGYMNVCVDEKLVSDSQVLIKVLEYLSYDSPLLEQNLRYELTTFAADYSVDVLGLYEKAARFEGLCIRVYNFQTGLWEKKLEAIEEAKRIVEELPKDLSEKKKAEKLYRYIAQNVKYKDYKNLGELEVKPYLYDALIKKKSHCDGYTNALALLFQVAGIESLEKAYTAKPEEVGHTWNMYAINGVWYNADAVPNEEETKEEKEYRLRYHFAFSDLLQSYVPNQKELYPICEQAGKIPVKHMEDANASKFRQSIIKGLESKEEQIIILLDSYDETEVDWQMQEVANSIQGTVRWFVYSVIEERTALQVYR